MYVGYAISDGSAAASLNIYVNIEFPFFEHVFACLAYLMFNALLSQIRCIHKRQIAF